EHNGTQRSMSTVWIKVVQEKRADTVGELLVHAASAAKREVRVTARGTPVTHATIRPRFIAAAVATCCKWVLARPRYRVCRRPNARTPCESVPSTPAR